MSEMTQTAAYINHHIVVPVHIYRVYIYTDRKRVRISLNLNLLVNKSVLTEYDLDLL